MLASRSVTRSVCQSRDTHDVQVSRFWRDCAQKERKLREDAAALLAVTGACALRGEEPPAIIDAAVHVRTRAHVLIRACVRTHAPVRVGRCHARGCGAGAAAQVGARHVS